MVPQGGRPGLCARTVQPRTLLRIRHGRSQGPAPMALELYRKASAQGAEEATAGLERMQAAMVAAQDAEAEARRRREEELAHEREKLELQRRRAEAEAAKRERAAADARRRLEAEAEARRRREEDLALELEKLEIQRRRAEIESEAKARELAQLAERLKLEQQLAALKVDGTRMPGDGSARTAVPSPPGSAGTDRTRVEDTKGNKAYQYRGLGGATIRYAPPEFFEDEPQRKASDVWTFAMMCYPVFSRGRDPYDHLNSAPAIMKAIFREERPPRPNGVPDPVWELMVSCWAEEIGRGRDGPEARCGAARRAEACIGRRPGIRLGPLVPVPQVRRQGPDGDPAARRCEGNRARRDRGRCDPPHRYQQGPLGPGPQRQDLGDRVVSPHLLRRRHRCRQVGRRARPVLAVQEVRGQEPDGHQAVHGQQGVGVVGCQGRRRWVPYWTGAVSRLGRWPEPELRTTGGEGIAAAGLCLWA